MKKVALQTREGLHLARGDQLMIRIAAKKSISCDAQWFLLCSTEQVRGKQLLVFRRERTASPNCTEKARGESRLAELALDTSNLGQTLCKPKSPPLGKIVDAIILCNSPSTLHMSLVNGTSFAHSLLRSIPEPNDSPLLWVLKPGGTEPQLAQ